MTKTIITPVGISIFTNYKDRNSVVRDYPQLSRDYESIEHQFDRLKDLSSHSERMNSRYESDINHIKQRIKYLWLAEAKENSSAELQTLFEIAKAETDNLEVHLLATDTVLSVVACELIQEWLMENPVINGHKVTCLYHFNTHVVYGLQVKDAIRFKTEGFQNLLILIKKYSIPKNTIINISGGYKGITPFITLFAQLEEIPIMYLYKEDIKKSDMEDNAVLLTVGNLPFNFDFSLFTDEYAAFESIKPGKSEKNLPSKTEFIGRLSTPQAYKKIEEALLVFEKDDKVHLSELGSLLYARYEKNDEENGFNASNLLGKVMEIKVFEYFQKRLPQSVTVLGKGIGKSEAGDAYDLDVFVEDDEMIWAIEVKPQNIGILITDDMTASKQSDTIEYKCKQGAFFFANEHYPNKQRHIALIMYHHLEPDKYKIDNFSKLQERYTYIRWIWLQPPANYKGNVNWSITKEKFREFDFKSKEWINFEL